MSPSGNADAATAARVLYLHRRRPGDDDPWFAALRDAMDPRHHLIPIDHEQDLLTQFRDVHVVIDAGAIGTPEMAVAAGAAGVRLWQLSSVGVDHLELHHWRDNGIPVAHCPGSTSAVALAEAAVMLMLMLSRRTREASGNLTAGVMGVPMGRELSGQRLGIVGFGASGRALARISWALGLEIWAVNSSSIPAEDAREFHLTRWLRADDLDLLAESVDILSLHLPLTERTRHLIDARRLSLMRPGALLINVSRGALVDEAALLAALDDGSLAGAGLDSFGQEPPPADWALMRHPRVVSTPHIAGVTDGTARRRARAIADNVDRIAAGQPPLHTVG